MRSNERRRELDDYPQGEVELSAVGKPLKGNHLFVHRTYLLPEDTQHHPGKEPEPMAPQGGQEPGRAESLVLLVEEFSCLLYWRHSWIAPALSPPCGFRRPSRKMQQKATLSQHSCGQLMLFSEAVPLAALTPTLTSNQGSPSPLTFLSPVGLLLSCLRALKAHPPRQPRGRVCEEASRSSLSLCASAYLIPGSNQAFIWIFSFPGWLPCPDWPVMQTLKI